MGKEGGGGGQAEGKEEPAAETQEEHDVEVELNSILKRSPSTSSPTWSLLSSRNNLACVSPSTDLSAKNSHHLLEILLPLLRQSEGHPRREIHHRARPLRRRARPPPARPQAPGLPREEHRPSHRAERADQRQEYRRRRRRRGARFGGHVGGEDQVDGWEEDYGGQGEGQIALDRRREGLACVVGGGRRREGCNCWQRSRWGRLRYGI